MLNHHCFEQSTTQAPPEKVVQEKWQLRRRADCA